jgi:hypothetical protein
MIMRKALVQQVFDGTNEISYRERIWIYGMGASPVFLFTLKPLSINTTPTRCSKKVPLKTYERFRLAL